MNERTDSADGVEVALELANGLSQWRRGRLAGSLPAERNGARATVNHLPDSMRLRRLRREVRSALAADTVSEACEILNGMLAVTGASPILITGHDGRWRIRLRSVRNDQMSRIAVHATTGMAALVHEGSWDGVRRCAADRCDDYFIDRSRNGSRRYCSRTCANRMNARTFRRRRGELDEVSEPNVEHV